MYLYCKHLPHFKGHKNKKQSVRLKYCCKGPNPKTHAKTRMYINIAPHFKALVSQKQNFTTVIS